MMLQKLGGTISKTTSETTSEIISDFMSELILHYTIPCDTLEITPDKNSEMISEVIFEIVPPNFRMMQLVYVPDGCITLHSNVCLSDLMLHSFYINPMIFNEFKLTDFTLDGCLIFSLIASKHDLLNARLHSYNFKMLFFHVVFFSSITE